MKDLIAPAYMSPLTSNPLLINAFTSQYEVLQSPLWVGNLLSKVTGLFISGRETSVPGLCQLKHENQQRQENSSRCLCEGGQQGRLFRLLLFTPCPYTWME